MKVYLDDDREAPDGWTRTRNVESATFLLGSRRVTHLSLDFDLEPQHYAGELDAKTGVAVLYWLRDQLESDSTFPVPVISIHSQNVWGADMMAKLRQEIYQRFGEPKNDIDTK